LGSLIKDRVENCPEVRFVSLTLIIGNHNYSSWSLRLWLYLKESQLDFQIEPEAPGAGQCTSFER
jgi:hypothetical protein